jgi:HAD superfamily hydrolase (TIGR01509 family)
MTLPVSNREEPQYAIGQGFSDGWTPQAVAFDCDGTLVDSEHCLTQAHIALFGRRGLQFGPGHELLVYGRSLPEKCALFAEVLGEQGNEAAISTELLALALDAISAGATARPGARDLLALVASAVPVAVVSNSPRTLLRASLSRAGLADLLPITVAADTVTRAKPAPDPYLAACSLLGVPPADTLAVEDSPIGLDSARAAGLVTLAVPSNPGLTLRANRTVTTLHDPDLLAWVRTWPAMAMSSPGVSAHEHDPVICPA